MCVGWYNLTLMEFMFGFSLLVLLLLLLYIFPSVPFSGGCTIYGVVSNEYCTNLNVLRLSRSR